MSRPNLYLGTSAFVSGDEIHLNNSVVSVGTPVNTTDAVNKLYVDELVTSQTQRIDAILSGSSVDLDSLKEIVDFANTLNASEAASLASAVVTINSNITSVRDDLTTEISDRKNADITIVQAISNEESERKIADSLMSYNIDSVTTNFNSYQISNNVRSTNIETSVADEMDTRIMAVNSLQTNIDNLKTSTESAASALHIDLVNYVDTNVSSEITNRVAAVSALEAKHNLDVSELKSSDIDIRNLLISETTARTTKDDSLQLNINTLTDAVNVSISALRSVDSSIRSDLSDEIVNRTNASSALYSELYTSIDSNKALQLTVNQLFSAELAAETVARVAADIGHDTTIADAVILLNGVDTGLRNDLTADTVARVAADIAHDSSIAAAVAKEKADVDALIVVDTGLRTDLTFEVSERIREESLMKTSIANIITKEETDNTFLRAKYDALETSLFNEGTTRASSDAELLNKIDVLFLYFFHHNSSGAYNDQDNQVQFTPI